METKTQWLSLLWLNNEYDIYFAQSKWFQPFHHIVREIKLFRKCSIDYATGASNSTHRRSYDTIITGLQRPGSSFIFLQTLSLNTLCSISAPILCISHDFGVILRDQNPRSASKIHLQVLKNFILSQNCHFHFNPELSLLQYKPEPWTYRGKGTSVLSLSTWLLQPCYFLAFLEPMRSSEKVGKILHLHFSLPDSHLMTSDNPLYGRYVGFLCSTGGVPRRSCENSGLSHCPEWTITRGLQSWNPSLLNSHSLKHTIQSFIFGFSLPEQGETKLKETSQTVLKR